MSNPAIEQLRSHLSNDRRPILVLSDFDGTLCYDYNHNEGTVDREPLVRDEVILAGQGVSLLIATARRLDHPNVKKPWGIGLVDETFPIILENGGITARLIDGELKDDTAQDVHEVIQSIHGLRDRILDIDRPKDTKLVTKLGRTLLVLILRDNDGGQLEKALSIEKHEWFARELSELIDTGAFNIVSSNDSVTIQAHGITKASAFRRLIEVQDLDRRGICVVGMGDGENDVPILDEADIAVSFGTNGILRSYSDIKMPGDHLSTSQVLGVITEFTERNGAVRLT
jgi:hydroxymethylpyrimidine pyrophosphatase-like HAD family hydrolase